MTSNFLSKTGSFLKRQMRALRMARKGNVAMIFALSVVPLLLAGGSGIDLARSLTVRSKLYAAVDAAALAVASKTGITQGQAQILAQQYFDANYSLDGSFGAPDPVTVTISGQQVNVTSDIAMPTTLMNIAGIHNVNLTASSDVVWGQTKIWVGLALDTTGSMCQSDTSTSTGPCPNPATNTKIYALKAATRSLLTMFQNASANPGDVRVSLVPFSRTVNVGAANSGATWIDWTEWDAANGGTCTINGVVNGAYTTAAACTSAGTCSISGNTTQSACQAAFVGACTVNGVVNSNYGNQNACNNAGSCSISGNNSQNSCTNATTGVCTINGVVNTNYTGQNSCQNAYVNVCSISGYNSQNSCQNAYVNTCSISGYTSQASCTAAYVNTCSIAGYSTQASCQNARVCSNPGKTTQSSCINTNACSNASYTAKNPCQNAGFIWGKGTWNAGVWNKVYGTWNRTYGVWSSVYGIWTQVNGVWTATPGVWSTAYGVWTPATNPVWTANRSGWTGCIEDRGLSSGPSSSPAYDVVNNAPGNSPESKFPAVAYNACPAAMQSLGYNWTTLNSTVDGLVAQGNTNQPIGLAWAWHSLTQGAPLSPPSLPSQTARHIIILSDGENTDNRWNMNRTNIDARMALVCTNAKADNIIIWSVFVNIAGTAGNAQSMKDCATGGATGGHYIEVTSAGGIGNAFNIIGQQITNLRVAH